MAPQSSRWKPQTGWASCVCFSPGHPPGSQLSHFERGTAGGQGREGASVCHALSLVTSLTGKNQNRFGRGGSRGSENQEGADRGDARTSLGSSILTSLPKVWGSFLRPLWSQVSSCLALSCLWGLRVRMGTEVQPLGATHSCPEGPGKCPGMERSRTA